MSPGRTNLCQLPLFDIAVLKGDSVYLILIVEGRDGSSNVRSIYLFKHCS